MDKTKNIFLDIRRSDGGLIYSNFSAEDHRNYLEAQKENHGLPVKARLIERKEYKAKFLTRDSDLVASKRLFNKVVKLVENTLEFFVEGLSRIEENNTRSISRLEHNISTYNALSLQEIEVLIPQSKIAGKQWSEKLSFVENKLSQNIKTTAETFLRISKYALGTKSELTAYEMLFKKPNDLRVKKHQVFQVLMNSLHHFFPDFNDKSIQVQMQFHNAESVFDYDSVSVVLYHVLNNATKYCVPHNPINISIRVHGNVTKVEFSMLSLRIEESEIKDIFKEGYSGKHAVTAQIHGRGIGMYVAKELMQFNNGDIEIQTTRSINKTYKGRYYEQNTFVLTLNSVQAEK